MSLSDMINAGIERNVKDEEFLRKQDIRCQLLQEQTRHEALLNRAKGEKSGRNRNEKSAE